MDIANEFARSILNDNPYFSAGAGLFGVGMGVALLRRCGQIASVVLRRNLTLTMEIASHDTSYQWVMHWLSKRARSSQGGRFQRGAGQHLSVETNVVRTEAGRIKAAFDFIPSTGVHYIFHQGRILRIERVRSQQSLQGASVAPFESVTLTTLGFDTKVFTDILEEARQAAILKDEGWTVIYKAFGAEWRQFGYPRPRRPLNSVVLGEGIAESVTADIKEFISSSAWYSARGIPYRRGYLLYGPPGCGKSSFITALAGHLEYNICVLNLSEVGMSADRLDHLLTHAPLQSVILLEDIDAALHSREENDDMGQRYGLVEWYPKSHPFILTDKYVHAVFSMFVEEGRGHGFEALWSASCGLNSLPLTEEDSGFVARCSLPDVVVSFDASLSIFYTLVDLFDLIYKMVSDGRAYEGMPGLTMSGLLNALDGVASTEGRILFMTTNYINRLDPALVRPGRVDFKAEIGLCTEDQLRRMFSRFYPQKIEGEVSTIPQHPLASTFASTLGPDLVSAAQVQGFLLVHKDSPHSALDSLPQFKQECLVERKKLRPAV